MKGASVVGVAGLAGCSGGDGGDGGGDGGSDGGGSDGGGSDGGGSDGGGSDGGGSDGGGGEQTATAEAEAPFTTEQLREKSKAEAEEQGGSLKWMTYTTTDVKAMRAFVDEINNQFDTPWINHGGITGSQNKLIPRFLQEKRNRDQPPADLVNYRDFLVVDDLNAEQHIRFDLMDQIQILNEVPENIVGDAWVKNAEMGSTLNLMYNEEIVEEKGIDLQPLKDAKYTFEALLEDEYEGLNIVQDFTPKERMMGWACVHSGGELDMDPIPYAKALSDHLNWKWTDGHSAASRLCGGGGAAFQFLTIPDHVIEFSDKGLPVNLIYDHVAPNFMPPGSPWQAVKGSQNPWTTLFILSAVLEPEIQRQVPNLLNETPSRPDLEYPDLDPRLVRLLKSDVESESPEDFQRFFELSPKIMEQGFGSPQP